MSSDAGCRHLLSPLILPSQNLPFWAALVPSLFLFEYNYKCDRTSLHYCARVEDSAPIFFDKMKVLQKLFDSGDRFIVNVDSKLKKAQSSGWVNSQRLPATTLFQNYSGAAQICHLLRRTLKLWSRGRSAVFFGWKIYFRRCRLQIFVGGGTCCMWRPCNSWLRSYFTCLGRRASITSITVVTKLRLCRKPPTMELRPSKTFASIRGSTGRS